MFTYTKPWRRYHRQPRGVEVKHRIIEVQAAVLEQVIGQGLTNNGHHNLGLAQGEAGDDRVDNSVILKILCGWVGVIRNNVIKISNLFLMYSINVSVQCKLSI